MRWGGIRSRPKASLVRRSADALQSHAVNGLPAGGLRLCLHDTRKGICHRFRGMLGWGETAKIDLLSLDFLYSSLWHGICFPARFNLGPQSWELGRPGLLQSSGEKVRP